MNTLNTKCLCGKRGMNITNTNTAERVMSINLTNIPKSEQEGVLASFWTMLQTIEGEADHTNNLLDRHLVSQMYNQWNRITGDNKVPVWERRIKP